MGASGSPCSEFTLRRRVNFYEVDSAGIVHFTNYFRYMEEAEHAMWREAGLSIARADKDVGFPRVAAGFEYHRPLRLEEEFDVRITIVAISKRSMKYSIALTRSGESIATGSLTVVCVQHKPNEPMKAVPIPPHILERFAVAPGAVS